MTTSPLATVCFVACVAAPCLAGPRTFVSGFGNDANSGTINSPKRSFAAAMLVTDPGGEIVALDSAAYGAIVISQSVSVIAPPGIYAGITPPSGAAVTVNVATGDEVVLRGLTMQCGLGTSGVQINSAGKVHVESCVMNGRGSGAGIYLIDSAATASARLFVSDSTCRAYGVGVQVSGGSALLDHVRLEQLSGGGLIVQNTGGPSTPRATMANSVASDAEPGIYVGRSGELTLDSCAISNNRRAGVDAEFGGIARVSNCTIANNDVGLLNFSSTIKSRGNNTVDGNATNVSGAITALGGL